MLLRNSLKINKQIMLSRIGFVGPRHCLMPSTIYNVPLVILLLKDRIHETQYMKENECLWIWTIHFFFEHFHGLGFMYCTVPILFLKTLLQNKKSRISQESQHQPITCREQCVPCVGAQYTWCACITGPKSGSRYLIWTFRFACIVD